MKNELPSIEVLGEWDHGMCDPVMENHMDDSESGSSMEDVNIDFATSCRKLTGSIISAEQSVEGALRLALLKMERRIEGLLRRSSHEHETR